MSDPKIDKLHILGRMLKTEEYLVDRLLDSDRLNVSDEAKDFSRAIINYSRESQREVHASDVHHIYETNFSDRENTDEFRTVADIFTSEFHRYDEES